jgi:hypothetical protein
MYLVWIISMVSGHLVKLKKMYREEKPLGNTLLLIRVREAKYPTYKNGDKLSFMYFDFSFFGQRMKKIRYLTVNSIPQNLCGFNFLWMQISSISVISIYSRAPVPTDSVFAVYRGPKKVLRKLKKSMVNKFQNARQARTDRNMVKSSSSNAPSTWLIFLCPRIHASPQNLPPFRF